MADTLSRRHFIKSTILQGASLTALGGLGCFKNTQHSSLPNIIIVYTDDQGYADVGVFGAEGFTTPNLDGMADQGMRFTSYHAAQPVCSASRAALLTGCYPNRIGIRGALNSNSGYGIHKDEMTLAELVKQKGYTTGIFGKWHLGCKEPYLPLQNGFDEYFGLPYSNDMWPFHPTAGKNFPDLSLFDGDTVVEYNPDMNSLTTRYTERAVQFIEKNKEKPFFLYLAHSMPHVPLGVSDKFKGKSEQGMYGDVIMEIDWSVGQVLQALKTHGLDENTLIIFTSDNGPWLSYGDHAGSAKPLREGKMTTWEGGHRVPCIMRWPGKIKENSLCTEPVMNIDIFPTIAGLIGGQLPNHIIDGLDIWPLMAGESGAASPHDALYFYWLDDLEAVRMGNWKFHFPHEYRSLNGRPGGTGGMPAKLDHLKTDWALYDLEKDIGETTNLISQYPEIAEKLKQKGLAFDAELKANLRPHGVMAE